MSLLNVLINNLPSVSSPTQKKLPFKEKAKWTIIMLVAFFILGIVPLFGLGASFLEQFEYLSMILAAEFGSLVSLGIGPIVTASIVLQLLNGSGIWKFDLTSAEGKSFFQGVQKLLAIFFVIFESFIFVMLGALGAESPNLRWVLIFQLILGGFLIILMDEVVQKWGIGSGISLFIAGGVSKEIFVKAFSWIKLEGSDYSVGAVIRFFEAIFAADLAIAGQSLGLIISTLVIFAIAVYLQAMKVEIPLSFGRVRGHGVRWPLNFLYTSVLPVILVAALFANLQLLAQMLVSKGYGFLGNPENNTGFVSWLHAPGDHTGLIGLIIQSGGFFNIGITPYLQSITYMLAMIIGCVVFSYFWVQTAGMDAKSQAKNMMSSGLQIPGFRKDQRVLERLLKRYIGPLTIMGGIAIGFIASFADILGALSMGTGILLAVMIIYKIYEEIAKQHMMDMHPAMRKFMEK
ncbi:MAG: preprotein translocase subunit SecY [Candidatus Woesearchaeota archaeon]